MKVKAHKRRVGGRTIKVKAHTRKHSSGPHKGEYKRVRGPKGAKGAKARRRHNHAVRRRRGDDY